MIKGKINGPWNIGHWPKYILRGQSLCLIDPLSQVQHFSIKQSSRYGAKSLDHKYRSLTYIYLMMSIFVSHCSNIPTMMFTHQIILKILNKITRPGNIGHHHHHIHFRALFSSTEGWAFWQVFLEGILSTQNDFEGQQNPYLASFCHSQALHPMISLACQIFSVQPHSACILLQSSLCCALHVQTISSYWCGAPHLSPGCQALWEGSLS